MLNLNTWNLQKQRMIVAARGEEQEVEEVGEGCQKGHPASYKVSKI